MTRKGTAKRLVAIRLRIARVLALVGDCETDLEAQ